MNSADKGMLCHKIGKLVPVFQMNMLLPFLNLKIEAACSVTTLIHGVPSQKTVIFLKCEVIWSFDVGILPLELLSFWSVSSIYCSKKKTEEYKRVNSFWTWCIPIRKKGGKALLQFNPLEVAGPRGWKIANLNRPNQANAFLPSHLGTETSIEISNFCHCYIPSLC